MAEIVGQGLWLNRRGEAVDPAYIKPEEKIKDEMVEELLNKAQQMSSQIAIFKQEANDRVESYFELLLQNYNIDGKARSKKGNLSLENYSATTKVEIKIAEILDFDEKLQIAKLKIDEYLNDVTKDSPAEIKMLITKAFGVDKKGNVDAKKIFALKSYDIKDSRWQEAMQIIDESKQVSRTKPYIRFYTRASVDDEYKAIALNIAGV
ncbi:MAG: DUF3164 family protein [Campylobacterales bacterium]|nr:DUF3164 family protein [Campylobacterales bacterium]